MNGNKLFGMYDINVTISKIYPNLSSDLSTPHQCEHSFQELKRQLNDKTVNKRVIIVFGKRGLGE